ncbi:MAG: hypothetical protein KF769_05505 [Parvibaculum sp.]|nr:hypothetical protein [Parvibaculum sp.]
MSAPAKFGCGLCKFSDIANGATSGECRRNAPRIDSYGAAQWPIVGVADWCGDARPRDPKGGA